MLFFLFSETDKKRLDRWKRLCDIKSKFVESIFRLLLLLGSCFSQILHNSLKHGHKLLTIDIEENLLNI